jgi:hypothetical protein
MKSVKQRKTESRLSCISDWLILIAQDQLNISDKCRLPYPFLDFIAQPPKPKVLGRMRDERLWPSLKWQI